MSKRTFFSAAIAFPFPDFSGIVQYTGAFPADTGYGAIYGLLYGGLAAEKVYKGANATAVFIGAAPVSSLYVGSLGLY